MAQTLVGLYEDFPTAQRVVRELEQAGIRHDDISLVANDKDSRHGTQSDRDGGDHAATGAGTGATVGTVIGGGAGLLAGLGALAIPGVGPVVAAGPLVATITGAGVGAASGGILGALAGLGVPEEDAHVYAEGVRRGGTLVTIKAPDDRVSQIEVIMEREAVDIDERGRSYRDAGWTRFDHTAEPYAAETAALTATPAGPGAGTVAGSTADRDRLADRTGTAAGSDEVIPVVEEDVQIGKRQVSGGVVRIRSYVVERPVTEEVRLHEEHVSVERRPASGDAPVGADAFREREIEVRETAEEAVVSKTARVREEVVVHKEAQDRVETISDTVRRTEVDVDREPRADIARTDTLPQDAANRNATIDRAAAGSKPSALGAGLDSEDEARAGERTRIERDSARSGSDVASDPLNKKT
jgi:uncharacterized protein (TIGR02271 family)